MRYDQKKQNQAFLRQCCKIEAFAFKFGIRHSAIIFVGWGMEKERRLMKPLKFL